MASQCCMGAVLSAAVALLTVVSSSAVAQVRGGGDVPGGASGYDVYADVVSVAPRYVWRDVRQPVRQCVSASLVYPADSWRPVGRRETYGYDVRRDPGAEATAGVLGGILGGLIGHQFGRGHGRVALTVAGALLGSTIARQQTRQEDLYRYDGAGRYVSADGPVHVMRHCTEQTQDRRVRAVDGYDVTYRYHDATFHKWMDEPPGDAVRVHVSVEPAGR